MIDQAIKANIEQALLDLKAGKMIIVKDDDDRENEGDLVMAAQFATPEAINFILSQARGVICVPMSQTRASHLNLAPMVINNEDPHQTAFTVSVDHISTTTGVSAFERAATCKALADPQSISSDFRKPGHLFPLIAKNGGIKVRQGHTEASVDLMKLAGCEPVAIICEILKADGEMARSADLAIFAKEYNLSIITIAQLQIYLADLETNFSDDSKLKQLNTIEQLPQNNTLEALASADLPTAFGEFRIHAFHNPNGSEPHLALVKGDIKKAQNVLTRVHSECQTGDIFHSLRCDCGKQLEFAMQEMQATDNAILIYLRQEGRGIGLIPKLKAYQLQSAGMDTVDANLSLGFSADARDFIIAADILKFFEVQSIQLMTNNPEKLAALKQQGIEISKHIKTPRFSNPHNEAYLSTKSAKMRHFL